MATKWTKETPTEEGYYFVKAEDEVYLAQVRKISGVGKNYIEAVFSSLDDEISIELESINKFYSYIKWYGPIEIPL